ncbi:MAG: ATP-binding protein [Pseudomonadota bacterium]
MAEPRAVPQIDRAFASTLPNVSEAVREIARFCRARLDSGEAGEIAAEQIELCVAEALTNVVKHAYDRRETETVRVSCALGPGKVVVEIRDNGRELPAEVLKRGALEPMTQVTGELPESGFGWHLILDQMDVVEYSREDGRNRLTLIKHLE